MKRPRWTDGKRITFVEKRRRSLRAPDIARIVIVPAEPRCPCCAGRRAVA